MRFSDEQSTAEVLRLIGRGRCRQDVTDSGDGNLGNDSETYVGETHAAHFS